MKSNVSMDTQVWQEPWFRALTCEFKLFWMLIYHECDIAGWWSPDWDLVNARLKSAVDPAAAQAIFESAGQVKVHPSGWWELVEYQAQQYPRGLKPTNGYHNGVLKLQARHHRREGGPVRSPQIFQTPSPEAALETLADAEPEGGSASETEGVNGSPTGGAGVGQACPTGGAGVGHRAKGSSPSHGPSHGHGLRAQAPSPGHGPQFPTGGPGGQGAPWEGQAREVALTALKMPLQAAGLNRLNDAAEIALERLLDTEGVEPGVEALKGFVKAFPSPTGDKLALWVRTRLGECDHPEDRRTWWTASLDTFTHGLKQRRWRCGLCRHVEDHGDAYVQAHEHAWSEPVVAPRLVRSPEGEQVRVGAYQRCSLCPAERAADTAQEVAA